MIDADRNLLFGILALQLDFISRDALIESMNAWVLDKSRPLGDILSQRGQLSAAHHALLEALVQEHLKLHGEDAARSLAALSSIGSVREDLYRTADPEVRAGLSHVSGDVNSQGNTPATRPPQSEEGGEGRPRFRILRPHARGGLGEVFVARDEELNREVALKEIQDRHADHLESRSRFMLEAEITGGLEHPGIVPVYSLGQYADGRPFYAMRFIRGNSLHDAIARFHREEAPGREAGARSLELRKLLGRFLDVCNAIAYAHSRGVLHRDLKPGNIMLGQYGETLVVDWGLAKLQSTVQEPGSDQGPLRLSANGGYTPTQMGTAIGTPHYMSPEQAAGRLDQLGPASDVYSLGATLYHLVTGSPPCMDSEGRAVLDRVERGDFLPPRQVNRLVPAALESICLKAMALRPADRYPSAGELARDVEHWLADEPVAAHREGRGERLARWTRRHRAWARAGAAALLLVSVVSIAAALVVDHFRREADENFTRAEEKNDLAVERLNQVVEKQKQLQTALGENRANLILSARFALYQRGVPLCEQGEAGEGLLWMARSLQLAPKDDGDLQHEIRRQMGSWRGQMVPLRASFDRDPAEFGPMADGQLLSRDARILATKQKETVRTWDTRTGQPFGPALVHPGPADLVRLSGDARTVLTAGENIKEQRQEIQLWDTSTGQHRDIVLPHRERVYQAFFSADDRTVLTCDARAQGMLFPCLWETATGKPVGTPLPLVRNVIPLGTSISMALLITEQVGIQLHDIQTGKPVGARASYPPQEQLLTLSPSGRLLLTRQKNPDTTESIAIRDPQHAGDPPDLLPHPGPIYQVVFSRDGKRLLTSSFHSKDRQSEVRLWDMGKRQLAGEPLRFQAQVARIAFGLEGKPLVVTRPAQDRAELQHWDIPTGKAIDSPWVQPAVPYVMVFGPGGKFVCLSGPNGKVQLWDTAQRRPVGEPLPAAVAFGGGLAFSPDGKTLAISHRNETGQLQTQLWDIAAAKVRGQALKHPSVPEGRLTFTPDGKALVRGAGSTVELWDPETGKLLAPAQTVPNARGFTEDGSAVVAIEDSPMAQAYSLATGAAVSTPFPISRTDQQNSVSSPDGSLYFTRATDLSKPGAVSSVRHIPSGKVTELPHLEGGAIGFLGFSADGKRLLLKGITGLEVWDTTTWKQISIARGLGGLVSGGVCTPDGRWFLAGDYGNAIRLWDLTTGTPGPPLAHPDNVLRLAISSDGSLLATGCKDRGVRLWEASTGRLLAGPLIHEDALHSIAFLPENGSLITETAMRVRLWEKVINPSHRLSLSLGVPVTSLAFLPDGKQLMTGGGNYPPAGGFQEAIQDEIRHWSVETGKPVGKPIEHVNELTLAIRPDGEAMFTRQRQGRTARLRSTRTGEVIGTPFQFDRVTPMKGGRVIYIPRVAGQSHEISVTPAIFTSDGKGVLTLLNDTTAGVLEAGSWRVLGPTLQHADPVSAVAFSRDGSLILTGTDFSTRTAIRPAEGGAARVWEASTGKQLGDSIPHKSGIVALAMSPDGKTVLTGCADGTAHLWDRATGKERGLPLRHMREVVAVAFQPDGQLAVTASVDGTVRLWDAMTGLPAGAPLRHADPVLSLAFSPDGQSLATGSGDIGPSRGAVCLWRLSATIPGTPAEIARWTEAVTGKELDEAGAVRELSVEAWTQRRRLLGQ